MQVRDGDKRIVRLKEGAPRGRHVVIVDDLVQSGGTLLECAKLLQVTGAAAVSAFATHGVFPDGSYKRFLSADAGAGAGGSGRAGTAAFRYFWITDSGPATAAAVAPALAAPGSASWEKVAKTAVGGKKKKGQKVDSQMLGFGTGTNYSLLDRPE
jgi:hypothetical protein